MTTKRELRPLGSDLIEYLELDANYSNENSLSTRLRGNPQIATLPLTGWSDEAIHGLFDRRPDAPTHADRAKPASLRRSEINTLFDIVYNLVGYPRLINAFIEMMRETYVSRNVLRDDDRRRRMMLHTKGALDGKQFNFPLPRNWRPTARSLNVLGLTGSGKTTFARIMLQIFAVVIHHTSYQGRNLAFDQVPLVYVQIPFDGTIKSFLLNFCESVDRALGYSSYYQEALRVGSIAEMVSLMVRISDAIALGTLMIDDLHNLRVAKGPNIVIMFNLISSLIECAGISVCTLGTPSVKSIVTPGAANQRKLVLNGAFEFSLMRWNSPALLDFTEVLWSYLWVAHPVALTESIRLAWFKAGAGNPHFMVMALAQAQRNEIGARETIDELSFQHAATMNMAILQPAIRAMRLGTPTALLALDDMLVGNKLAELRQELGVTGSDTLHYVSSTSDEFPEVVRAEEKLKPKRTGASKSVGEEALPSAEDPFQMR